MTRALEGKVIIHGTLVAEVPLAVGGAGAGEQVDLDLAVNGAGEVYVPGSSLAGPMRAWLASFMEESVDRLFGDGDKASAVFIEDGSVTRTVRERRHGIAIDNAFGTTKEKFFYTRALLPRGTNVSLNMEMDLKRETPDDNQKNLNALAAIIRALQNGEIRFGACKTRGLGKLKLKPEDLEVDQYDFRKPAHLEAWLDGIRPGSEGRNFLAACEAANNSDSRLIEIQWRPASRLMVKSGRDGFETDIFPLLSGAHNGRLAPVIPGSSLKGVLRAHAEKILRTLVGNENGEPSMAIVKELFGSAESAGRLAIDDVYCVESIAAPEWISENTDALNAFSAHQQHVAIDRFTGGASTGALYSARPIKRETEWEPIRMTLNLAGRGKNALNETKRKQIWGLLTLLLLDLKEGMIPIGFGTRRGLGEIEILSDVGGILPAIKTLQEPWQEFIGNGCTF